MERRLFSTREEDGVGLNLIWILLLHLIIISQAVVRRTEAFTPLNT
jgi:hypothetical protein